MKAGDKVTIRRGRTYDQSLPGMAAVRGGDLAGCEAVVIDNPDRRASCVSDRDETRVHIAPTQGPNRGQLLDIPVEKLRRRGLGGVIDDVGNAVRGIRSRASTPRYRENYDRIEWDRHEKE